VPGVWPRRGERQAGSQEPIEIFSMMALDTFNMYQGKSLFALFIGNRWFSFVHSSRGHGRKWPICWRSLSASCSRSILDTR